MAARAADALRELRDTVGADHAREVSPFDGLPAAALVEPASVTELAAVQRTAHRRELSLVPTGLGTKIAWGPAAHHADILLSTRRLSRLLEHAAGDLVVRAEAGLPLDALQARLRSSGQIVALDPPAGGTVGGIVATNAAGPRRLRYGAPRDVLIGITVVLADGTVAKAGGKVVKNVAGYDLGKLFAGSLGTLGTIVETVFRLHPQPASRAFVRASFPTAAGGAQAIRAVAECTLVPSAAELAWSSSDGASRVVLLFEGVPPAVHDQAERARQLLAPLAQDVTIADSPERGWPMDIWPRIAADGARVKLVTPPADLAATIQAVAETARAKDLTATVNGQAASGVLYAALRGESPTRLRQALENLRASLAERAGTLTLLEAPSEIRQGIDGWGVGEGVLALMRRVKAQFDPDNLLSPGKM